MSNCLDYVNCCGKSQATEGSNISLGLDAELYKIQEGELHQLQTYMYSFLCFLDCGCDVTKITTPLVSLLLWITTWNGNWNWN